MEAKPLLILGTSYLAYELADYLSDMPEWRLDGFVENLDLDRCQETMLGKRIYWVEEIAGMAATHHVVCGISTTQRVTYIEQVEAMGMRFATLIHPAARVSRTTEIGAGSIISPGVHIASHARIGCNVFVNRGVLIGHHTVIDDLVTIQPGANIAGVCRIGRGAYIAMAAVVLDRKRVGAHAVVGAGSVITRDVPDNVQVVGMPGRVVKEGVCGK